MPKSLISQNKEKIMNPTPEVKDAILQLFVACAWQQTVEPVVSAYETAILTHYQWPINPVFIERARQRGGVPADWLKPISELKNAHLLSFENADVFHALCYKMHPLFGFKLCHEEYDPLLVANTRVTQAECQLIALLEPLTGVRLRPTFTKELRDKYIELILELSTKGFAQEDFSRQEVLMDNLLEEHTIHGSIAPFDAQLLADCLAENESASPTP